MATKSRNGKKLPGLRLSNLHNWEAEASQANLLCHPNQLMMIKDQNSIELGNQQPCIQLSGGMPKYGSDLIYPAYVARLWI